MLQSANFADKAGDRCSLWCWGRSVEITHNDVIRVRVHYARPHRDKCAVPFGREETTGCCWWCCWMGFRRWGLGTFVFGRCSKRVTLFTIVNTKNGVEQGYWNDLTEWWLLTRKGFLYEIDRWRSLSMSHSRYSCVSRRKVQANVHGFPKWSTSISLRSFLYFQEFRPAVFSVAFARVSWWGKVGRRRLTSAHIGWMTIFILAVFIGFK